MFSFLYHTFVYDPLYNGLIFLLYVFPWMDAGVAVVIFTIIVRLILYPLSKKAVVTQVRMKELEPQLNKIREATKNDRNAQALQTMALYKNNKVSPFSSFLVLAIQLPIILALYSIFLNSGLPTVNMEILYPFFGHAPFVNMHFLGIINISLSSTLLALLAAASQYFQLHYSISSMQTPGGPSGNAQMDMAANMTKNMKYVFPFIVFFISYKISAVVALYWTVTNLFTLGQELVVRRHLKKHQPL
jgi:YidC/Oxa1 family membrane protein insertase